MLFGNNSSPSAEAVGDLVSNLTTVTSSESAGNSSHFPSDLNTTNTVVTMVVEFLLESAEDTDPDELLPFNEVSPARPKKCLAIQDKGSKFLRNLKGEAYSSHSLSLAKLLLTIIYYIVLQLCA